MRLIIVSLTILSGVFSIQAQTCPKVVFYGNETSNGGCIQGGTVTLSLAVCPNSIADPYQIESVVWTMGDGTTKTTNSLQVTHTYQNTNTYSVSAIATINVNGVSCSSDAVNLTSNGANLNAICDATTTTTTFLVRVNTLSIDLVATPNNPVPLDTDPISLVMDFSNFGSPAIGYTYELSVDGERVIPAGTSAAPALPTAGPVTLLTKTFNEGQHLAELSVRNTALPTCPLNVVTVFDVRHESEDDPTQCNQCFTFRPSANKRYWVSAWVKEIHPSQVKTYTNTSVNLIFNGTAQSVEFKPTGDIIDGWQRIVGEFTVPVGTQTIDIRLANAVGSVDAYFDDIRIHPFNGSMKSYVNDPETFWLTAELDDNNYATFYEYDKEGKLIRIKKETANGIMTIQESRTSNPKNE
ncbi:MAG: PKD domain-containing protein [Fluviicola sp.]|nr:PKD domain-containing protein [Fluviicola sp.]